MTTKKRFFPPNSAHHIYNRGNQKMTLFHCHKDYKFFLDRIKKYQKRHPVEIISYCLMPNHFHLLLREPLIRKERSYYGSEIESFMHKLQTSYAKHYCGVSQNYSGSVFQGRYQNKYIEDEKYYLTVKSYIEQNPVRSRLVRSAEQWPYSSALFNPRGGTKFFA